MIGKKFFSEYVVTLRFDRVCTQYTSKRIDVKLFTIKRQFF